MYYILSKHRNVVIIVYTIFAQHVLLINSTNLWFDCIPWGHINHELLVHPVFAFNTFTWCYSFMYSLTASTEFAVTVN